MRNPFINIPEFPDFPAMTPAAADEALPMLLEQARKGFDELEARATACWKDLFEEGDKVMRPLSDAWSYVGHMLGTCNSDEWRKIDEKYRPQLIEVFLRVGQSRKMYDLMCELRAKGGLDPVKQRILDKAIRGAKQSGVGLDGEKKERFNAIRKEMSSISMKFSNNVLDGIKAFSLVVPSVDGLPAAIADSIKCEGGYKLTIDNAVYPQAMMHLKDRAVREKLYRARSTRSSFGEFDNTILIDRRLALSQELAKLLDYANAAEMSVSGKCAGTVKAVNEMLDTLTAAAKPAAIREDEELDAYARKLGVTEMAPWDRSFYAERLREERYSYSAEELSQYFEFKNVLTGLFGLTNRLFGVTVEDRTGEVPVWHPDVRFFAVKNAKGEVIAHLYADPYVRPETKSGGAWMNSFRSRRPGELPLAVICCNQPKPDSRGRCLMPLREVETLFHEFGHSLQDMLTQVDDPNVSGLSLIEWDAVEVASQFMENWCYDVPTVRGMAWHCETGRPISDELLEKVRAAKNYRAASACMRQLAFAKTDIVLYTGGYEGTPNDVKERVFTDCLFPHVPEDRMLQSFSHIFAGGYSAGYYSYKWSEVMSCDCFGAFEDAGLENEAAVREVGRRYRDTILALGGSKNPMEVFEMFRGRKPTVDAMLRQQGMK